MNSPNVVKPHAFRVAAIILAGGRSVRMGMDKAQVRIAGKRFIDILLSEIPPTITPIVVSPYDLGVDCLCTCENPPFQGPVAGIAAGLNYCHWADAVSILAVDAPYSARLIPRQLSVLMANPAVDAVAISANNFIHPIGITWRSSALKTIMVRLNGDYNVALKSLLNDAHIATILADGTEQDYDTREELENYGN